MGEPYQRGTFPPPPIAVAVGQRRYVDLDGNEVVVSVNSNSEVLPPISVFRYAAAFSERLDARRFVLEVPLSGHEFTIRSGQRVFQTACSGLLRRRIKFCGRGTPWLRRFGNETDMPFLRMSEDVGYERRLTCMLRRIRNIISDGYLSQDSVLPRINLCCLDYRFLSA